MRGISEPTLESTAIWCGIQSITGTLNVTDVAEAPSLIFATQTLFVDENAGPLTVPFMISASGPVTYTITSNRPQMFKSLAIDIGNEPEGNLVFTTDVNRRGAGVITVTATSGGLSTSQSVRIVSQERNDAPTIEPVEELVLPRGTGGAMTTRLTGISPGIGETGDVRVRLADVTPSNFFDAVNLTLTADQKAADLNFTPSATATGPVQFTVEVSDLDSNGNIAITTTQRITLQLTDAAMTARVVNGKATLEAAATAAVNWQLDSNGGGLSLTATSGNLTPVSVNLQSLIREVTALLSPFADNSNARNVSQPVTALGFAGNDTLIGGSGDDVLFGAAGRDKLVGSEGNDTLRGRFNGVYLQGGDGNDVLDVRNFTGNATLKGGAGNDTLQGNAGRDTLDGGSNSDSIDGGANHADEIRFDLLDTVLADSLDLMRQLP